MKMVSFIYLAFIFFSNKLIKKKKLFLINTGFEHQSFINISTPLTGGLYLLFPAIYLFFMDHYLFIFTYMILFFLGMLSDLKILDSAKKRFFIQTIIVLSFTFFAQLEVTPTKIIFFDNMIENTYWSFIFTTFCLMILINGSNFIDGLNGLLLGYSLLIILTLFNLDLIYLLNFSKEAFFYFILVVLFLFVLNMSNRLFLGDNGAYSLSFLIGFILIKIYNLDQTISPYFIILLIWYPCFENLFSIIRKILIKKNPLEPDTGHFHQKLFILLKKKFRLTNFKSNILSSILILCFNFGIFYIASLKISHSIFQLTLLFLSISFYLIIYLLINELIKKDY